jgi:hypothetical protein
MLHDARGLAPMLREHVVKTLDDRVSILRRMVWDGEAAFSRRNGPIGGLRDPRMRQIGLEVTSSCRARDDMCELDAIYQTVKRNIRYTGDIATEDTFQTAWRTLQIGGGDCDDMAVLCAVLAMENGFVCKFRITSNTGATWDHIFCLAGVSKVSPRRWVPLDTTLPRGSLGTHPPMAKYRDFDLDRPGR